MTTTIQETTAPQSPVVEPLTDVERRARVLEAAALEIEVRGWRQESEGALPETVDSPRCLLGGILNVIGHSDSVERDWIRAAHAFGGHHRYTVLYRFNDRVNRTADEVTFLLRWRAQELRDGWDAA